MFKNLTRFARRKGETAFKFHATTRSRFGMVEKEVHLGQHTPTTHFTEVSHQYVEMKELQDR